VSSRRRPSPNDRVTKWARVLLFVFTALTLAAQEQHSRLPEQEKHPEASPATAGRKPNIVLMLTDNLGYGELGVYGGGILRGAPTPRIGGGWGLCTLTLLLDRLLPTPHML